MKEEHMRSRPKRIPFLKSKQKEILSKSNKFVLSDLLPNPKIDKIFIIGSIVKGNFGKYEKPFQGRTYSDIDYVLFVENNFKIPKWNVRLWRKRFKVFNRKKLERKYLIQYFVIKKKDYEDKKFQRIMEKHGVPLLLKNSKHKYKVIYNKS